VTDTFDWGAIKDFLVTPEITLDVYKQMPEDLSKMVEVVDGLLVRAESAEPAHQAIQLNLLITLREVVKAHDRQERTCHRVLGDVDVLIADVPRLHFRRPDVVIYRCIEENRSGKWRTKPYASDCVLVVEIVSADSVTSDIRDKLAEYAAAGIPHYWIVRMRDNNGPAISVERFELGTDGHFQQQNRAVRRLDFDAIDASRPFQVKVSWEQLDDGM
jgi:Uma2 family endonuclease